MTDGNLLNYYLVGRPLLFLFNRAARQKWIKNEIHNASGREIDQRRGSGSRWLLKNINRLGIPFQQENHLRRIKTIAAAQRKDCSCIGEEGSFCVYAFQWEILGRTCVSGVQDGHRRPRGPHIRGRSALDVA